MLVTDLCCFYWKIRWKTDIFALLVICVVFKLAKNPRNLSSFSFPLEFNERLLKYMASLLKHLKISLKGIKQGLVMLIFSWKFFKLIYINREKSPSLPLYLSLWVVGVHNMCMWGIVSTTTSKMNHKKFLIRDLSWCKVSFMILQSVRSLFSFWYCPWNLFRTTTTNARMLYQHH